ncbi:SGNH/GDSL hydrolase family protein [Salinimicrobium oceani]|uniref:SGNH/GDSL hydrolase family protein n=1 Tax=Salinimicrobium oceani TaxID=2722702 RepID=A0ABX1CYC5_9FLAO|nr:SGNH/GDSL hydrolase family protein [Salinimicrobium oceani]NJW52792.1 SGNH/GDSL hydrolase family protein [Salinimicrobium oceani]
MRPFFFLALLSLLISCKSEQAPQDQFFEDENDQFIYSGRILKTAEGTKLITSASSVKSNVYGDTVTVFLQSDNEQQHYVAIELNQEYIGRFRILKDTLKFPLPKKDSANTLVIYKETEAANGAVIFNGIRAGKIGNLTFQKRQKIEFIGDSITCGMGADTTEVGCEDGEWFDHHSAYMAYGPRVARALEVDFEVNCVSGMGMYRNWNDEDQPVMPDVYPYLHLNGNHGKRAEIDKKNPPDVVSIALGTNDFSLGDGDNIRPDFDAEKFKDNYVKFVEAIFKKYPETQVALLSSPMTGEAEGLALSKILHEVKAELPERAISIFEFEKFNGRGCTNHPSVDDHKIMADRLTPFYKDLLQKNQ